MLVDNIRRLLSRVYRRRAHLCELVSLILVMDMTRWPLLANHTHTLVHSVVVASRFLPSSVVPVSLSIHSRIRPLLATKKCSSRVGCHSINPKLRVA